MDRKRIATAAIGAVVVTAVGVVGYTSFTHRAAPQGPTAASPLGTPAARGESDPATGKTSAGPAQSMDCASASDRCDCQRRVAEEFLSSAFPAKALDLAASAAPSCSNRDVLNGIRAEALAATGASEEARRMANDVLSHDPKNRFARRAVAITQVNAAQWPDADAALSKLIAEDANDFDSLFYAALADSRRERYNEARQGFLRVLRLNKRHVDARYNLVTLVAGVGATAEAYHHFEELQSIAPAGDPRIASARAALGSTPPKEPPLILKQGGGEGGSASGG
jgi:tetratricopeptide (TPR) repeat protein